MTILAPNKPIQDIQDYSCSVIRNIFNGLVKSLYLRNKLVFSVFIYFQPV